MPDAATTNLGFLAALISFAAALISLFGSLVRSDSKVDPPPGPKFSLKALLKGQIAGILGTLVGAFVTAGYFVFKSSQLNIDPAALTPQESQDLCIQWMTTGAGPYIYWGTVFFFCAWITYAASSQAKRFRMMHGFLAVGIFWLLSEGLWRMTDPNYANFVSQIPSKVAVGGVVATFVGVLFGGIMGSED
jgi:hypothetical protein